MAYTLTSLLDTLASMPEFSGCKYVEANTKGVFGNYPLHVVSTWADKQAASILLENGADINSIGEGGETPIFRAITPANEAYLKFLISRGARTDIKRELDGRTPAEVAKLMDYHSIIVLLT